MRRLNPENLVEVTGPFNVFVSQDDEGDWLAHIVGTNGLDNMTWSDTPEGALHMAFDLLCTMTGRCSIEDAEHTLTIDTVYMPEDGGDAVPCWGCSQCALKVPKEYVVEDDDCD